MLRYIARRLLWLVFVLVVIVAITYSIFFLLPGGNTDTIAGRSAGKHGDTATLTSGRPAKGAPKASEAM